MRNRHSAQWAARQHAGTGGVVDKEDWRNINWTPISALTGGTSKFKTGLGMKPWYAKGHVDPAGPGDGSICRRPVAVSNDLLHLTLLWVVHVCMHHALQNILLHHKAGEVKQAYAAAMHTYGGHADIAAGAGLYPGKLLAF